MMASRQIDGLRRWARGGLLLVASSLFGCAAFDEPVPAELAFAPAAALVPFSPADAGKGEIPAAQMPAGLLRYARWSGLIAKVENRRETSWVEVVYLPLNAKGVPLQAEQSLGRFVAVFNGFIDPAIYAPGRSLTLLGTLGEPVAGHVGEFAYRFARLDVRQHKLWPKVVPVEVRYREPLFYPYGDPFWPRRWRR
ncbi:MAG: Slp family lipoprotein [Aeromonas sp.]